MSAISNHFLFANSILNSGNICLNIDFRILFSASSILTVAFLFASMNVQKIAVWLKIRIVVVRFRFLFCS